MIKAKTIFIHFNRLDKETKNLFRDFFTRENPLLMPGESHWSPNTDIYETSKGVVVKMELAGVSQEQIEISCEGSTIIISGHREDHGLTEKTRCLQIEIPYGEFRRKIILPKDLDFDRISARLQDGFLIIFVPLQKARKIPVS